MVPFEPVKPEPSSPPGAVTAGIPRLHDVLRVSARHVEVDTADKAIDRVQEALDAVEHAGEREAKLD